MSRMIRCNKCKRLMYADSRSNKGDYCEVRIDYVDGLSCIHLCKFCHRQFRTEFIRDMTPEEYNDVYGAWLDEEDSE